jgi:hypothetical protein
MRIFVFTPWASSNAGFKFTAMQRLAFIVTAAFAIALFTACKKKDAGHQFRCEAVVIAATNQPTSVVQYAYDGEKLVFVVFEVTTNTLTLRAHVSAETDDTTNWVQEASLTMSDGSSRNLLEKGGLFHCEGAKTVEGKLTCSRSDLEAYLKTPPPFSIEGLTRFAAARNPPKQP